MKVIPLSVRDFALPVPRTGSIEAHSGYREAAAQGQEIHQRIQSKISSQNPGYRAEVRMGQEFEAGEFTFRVGGRLDGIYEASGSEPPHIQEIKTGFNLKELLRKLEDGKETHPYCLQLRTYGYMHWREKQIVPKLSFHLVSTRSYETDDLEIELDLENYEAWLKLRLDELVEEARRGEARAKRRRKASASFPFPFARPRPGQEELIAEIEEGMRTRERMLIQAPTGLGKTVGVLYPTLKEALGRGQGVIYVTPKNSQHSVAEDAVSRLRDAGAKIRSITFTAKAKSCFKAEPLCNPSYCEFARDHYTKLAQGNVLEVLRKKKKLSLKVFQKIGQDYEVCPFEIQLDAAEDADVVICDYNYVFSPRSVFGRMSSIRIDQEGSPNLVIDEAHNLPGRAMDYYSPSLSSVVLEKMRDPIRKLPARFRGDCEDLLDDCIQVLLSCRPPDSNQPSEIDPPEEPFLEQDQRLRSFLSRYLESDMEIEARDPVLSLCFRWAEFTEALEFVKDANRTEFFTTFHPHPTGGTVKITCCDASEMLKPCYDEYENTVAFSATLKPFEYYARLAGLQDDKLRIAEFQSPFPKSHRKLLIIPQISTKYSERAKNYPRIAEVISRVAALKAGNYFAFFPSFDFMERVLAILEPPPGFEVIRQSREMRASDIEAILEHLRESPKPTLIFAVQGGVLSEGVDYPGEMIIGAFIVGPPLPSFDLERERMKAYYDEHYQAGFDYAYTYPAMAKAVQAAGRVIRSEQDRGLIVLLDNRFLHPSYTSSMPKDWFEGNARELVSEAILRDISEFWAAKNSGGDGGLPDEISQDASFGPAKA